MTNNFPVLKGQRGYCQRIRDCRNYILSPCGAPSNIPLSSFIPYNGLDLDVISIVGGALQDTTSWLRFETFSIKIFATHFQSALMVIMKHSRIQTFSVCWKTRPSIAWNILSNFCCCCFFVWILQQVTRSIRRRSSSLMSRWISYQHPGVVTSVWQLVLSQRF